MSSYQQFIATKTREVQPMGFELAGVEYGLIYQVAFPWQLRVVEWAVHRGRAALFEECGLGKTLQQLAWAVAVTVHTGKPVVIHCPVGVRRQTLSEAMKFGFAGFTQVRIADDAAVVCDGEGIYLVNYEKLHRFDTSVFAGVVLDESSVLKNFTGKVKRQLIEAYSETPYRLA